MVRRLTGIGIISVYVTRRCSRPDRFGRNRRHFVYVTFRIRFAAARADPANRVGRPPVLDAMLRQEASPRGKGQLGVMFADEAVGQVNQQLRQPGAGPEHGTSQALDIDRHVNGLPWTEGAAAEPAVDRQTEAYQSVSDMVPWSSGDARISPIRASALPSFRAYDRGSVCRAGILRGGVRR
jgi:hypothetical protein